MKQGEKGFTLVEALTAIVILAFGLIAITNLMLVAASSNSVANQGTAAAAAASEIMEELRAVPFETLAPAGDLDNNAPGCFREVDVPGVGLVRTRWLIQNFVPPNPRALFITVRSEGTGALSIGRSRAEFTTIRSCTNAAIGC